MKLAIIALALLGGAPPPSAANPVALFRASNFPTADAPAIPNATLDEALATIPHETLDDLRVLSTGKHSLLLLPYGSAFPLAAWPEIRNFVRSGGNLVVLGGAPFGLPILKSGDVWQPGTREPAFAHEFLIGPAEAVNAANLRPAIVDPSWPAAISGARTVWELTLRFGTRADSAGEGGSEAHRDAVARPLVHLVDAGGIARACPLIEIDRLRGSDAGGRWIFATSDAPLDAATIRAIVTRAMEGASDLDARPVHASVEAGETPLIRIASRRPAHVTLVVRDDKGAEVRRASGEAGETVEIRVERPLAPGLYHVEVTADAQWHPATTTTGFWVRDAALLARGPRMTVSRDWLRRDGKVFPVIGTTYMASDVHRKFLFEPNPHVWDRDFAEMHRLGINFLRTGIWTGWSRAMLNSGAIDEGVLRALDAYVQTAAKHDIVVAFTFFAFLPPSFGGTNPYLDPRSIDGQRDFITAFAKRFRNVGWIHYDLINEPSYAPPEGLWSNRPIRDEWERRAWRDWVRAHYGDDVPTLRNRWQDTSDDVFGLPWDHEVFPSQIREDRRPWKGFDFTLFSQDAVAGWARTLREALRAAGGDPLVTLGQDEGGTGMRPSQQLHADAVDYTAVHPWWQNDDVLATGVMTKVPEKPLLFQEVGLMRLEDANGTPWRSPSLAASVLERKYAFGFASRAAGVVEWAWNINPYMPIDNESTIGFFRPDGTAKPELDVVPRFAKFFREAAPYLDDFAPDPVVVVIPQSRLFMNRPAALDGVRRIVRVLAESFGIVPTAISDLRLSAARLKDAQLVIVPSVEFLDQPVVAKRVVFTGAVAGRESRPVQFREMTSAGWATFDRGLQEGLRRSVTGDETHEAIPVEFAREDAPLIAFLTKALADAGVATHPATDGVAVRLLEAPRAILAIAVNETSVDARRRVGPIEICVQAGRSQLVLFERTGKVLARSALDCDSP